MIIKFTECPMCFGEGILKAILPIAEKPNGHDRSDVAIICPKCDGSGEINAEDIYFKLK